MAAVTIRNLSEETHRALKIRAAQHNRSTEAEIRAILESAVRPEGRLRLGTALAEMSRKIGVTNADVDALDEAREPDARRAAAASNDPARYECRLGGDEARAGPRRSRLARRAGGGDALSLQRHDRRADRSASARCPGAVARTS